MSAGTTNTSTMSSGARFGLWASQCQPSATRRYRSPAAKSRATLLNSNSPTRRTCLQSERSTRPSSPSPAARVRRSRSTSTRCACRCSTNSNVTATERGRRCSIRAPKGGCHTERGRHGGRRRRRRAGFPMRAASHTTGATRKRRCVRVCRSGKPGPRRGTANAPRSPPPSRPGRRGSATRGAPPPPRARPAPAPGRAAPAMGAPGRRTPPRSR